MKIRTFAGLLCIAGGLALIGLWIFFMSHVLDQSHPDITSLIEGIGAFITRGDTLDFFVKSALCVFACFLSGALILLKKYSRISILLVLVNSVAVSIMYAWFITALIASPLLFSYWVVTDA